MHTDHFEKIKDALGMQSLQVRTAIELHECIAEGLPRSAAVHLVHRLLALPLEDNLRALNVSHRTWNRFLAEPGKPLDVDHSARLWSMAEIVTKAQEVLGTYEQVQAWLACPALGLDSRRPIDLMSTPQGTELVQTLLGRIEHGVYV